jgi:hypothetical protein
MLVQRCPTLINMSSGLCQSGGVGDMSVIYLEGMWFLSNAFCSGEPSKHHRVSYAAGFVHLSGQRLGAWLLVGD